MEGTLTIIASAIAVFAATNIDDLIVLTALFSADRPGRGAVIVGQYLGIATIVAVSVFAAIGLLVVPERWIGLLGVIPIAIGIRGLLCPAEGRPVVANGVLGVAGITIANGADNIAVYTPLFRKAGWASLGYVVVFAILVAVWCGAAGFLVSRPMVARTLERWGHRIVPAVFIAIGLLLLVGVVRGSYHG